MPSGDALGGPVLGRPLRSRRRPIWIQVVHRDARRRPHAGRDEGTTGKNVRRRRRSLTTGIGRGDNQVAASQIQLLLILHSSISVIVSKPIIFSYSGNRPVRIHSWLY